MTARNPLWEQNGTTSAEEDRALIRALLSNQGGVFGSGDLAVAQHGTPNMSVDVAAGRAAIPGTESASLQGTYVGWLDATLNVAIAASDATNARIDLIVARIKDQQYSGASNTFTVEAVTGTPSGSPAVPTAPANTIILAQIAVAATVTTIVTGNITDKRAPAGVRAPVVSAVARYQASPTDGQDVYLASGDVNEGPWIYNGSAWRKPWNMPWGPVAPVAQATAAQATITTVADLTSLSITFTAVANRRYKVTVKSIVQCTVSGASAILTLCDASNTILNTMYFTAPAANGIGDASFTHDTTTPSAAGSYTFKLRLALNSGTGSVSSFAAATAPAQLTVEDIGPNGAPA